MIGRRYACGPRKSLLGDVVVFDFGDCWKRNLYDPAVGAKYFDAGGGQGLSAFHTPNRASDSPPISSDDFYVVSAIQRL